MNALLPVALFAWLAQAPGDFTPATFAPQRAAFDGSAPAEETIPSADGKCQITIDTTGAPEMTEWAHTKLGPTLAEWYPKVCQMLASDGYTPAASFSVVLKPGEGVAGTSAAEISGNSTWLGKEMKGQALGALIHEMAHVIQDYGWGRSHNPHAKGTPGWLTEGIADYIRWFQFEPDTHGADQIWLRHQRRFSGRYNEGYRVSANFLDWVTRHRDAQIVQRLNAVLREGKYDESIWKERTGETLAQLGADWKVDVDPFHAA